MAEYSSNTAETSEKTIGALVRENEQTYVYNTTTISKYVQFSMKDTLDRIDAYLNSQHISGKTDSKNREKPFFNIVTAAVNIWFRSTDIDRKDIKIRPSKSKDVVNAFLATVHLQYWMKKINFGSFLNDWGRSLARYGSSVVKFIEKDGDLHCDVIPWNRLIVDSIDFDSNIKIEILELTEAQLYERKGYDPLMVEKLCNAITTRKTLEGVQKDVKSDYIRLYEVHGNLPLSYLTGKENDDDTYVQQMHVISFVESKENGKFDDYTLISGKEKNDPYMITHLIREDGRTLSIGAVEHLFEAQWMMNHTAKSIKDQLDLASKLIFQTSDENFVGQNALSAIENGDILIHAVNQPLTQLANTSHDITALQSFGSQWKVLGNEIVGISESMLGNAAPSGTAWRQVETLLQENHSLFELMTENKALDLETMLRRYVIPYVQKQLNNGDEIAATLEQYDITKIDSKFVKNTATKMTNDKIKNMVLSGKVVSPEKQQTMMQDHTSEIQGQLSDMGNTRFFAPDEVDWSTELDGLEWDLDIDITDENLDKDAVTTINTMMMMIAKNPNILQDETMKFLFNRVLTLTGAVSPIELSSLPQTPPQPQPTPSPIAPPSTEPVPTQ